MYKKQFAVKQIDLIRLINESGARLLVLEVITVNP